jgi:A/G-specific adenine glycosylase
MNELLWDYYARHARDTLPWRQPDANGYFDPYKILVSEIMLQQTQVSRVIDAYKAWLVRFPDFATLAQASLADVLGEWLGLGYNRRAKFLHESAKQVVVSGIFPKTQAELTKLPGIGPNTAGAIVAYAYNQPVVFIETNIRTVFLFHFFEDQTDISDTELLPYIKQTLDSDKPREWYWALMDYGAYLKRTKGNFAKNSKHHVRQSTFIGSKRYIRGQVLKSLSENQQLSLEQLHERIGDERLPAVLADLQKEGFLIQKQDHVSLRE